MSSQRNEVGREEVIRLILCQLSAYGYPNLSQAIATHAKVPMTTDSNSRLAELVSAGLQSERSSTYNSNTKPTAKEEDDPEDFLKRKQPPAELVEFYPFYKNRHQRASTTAAFSSDGRYIATGSTDASLKIIDIEKVRGSAARGVQKREEKPVILTMYDHEAEVTDVAFHPNGLVLASCSVDQSIKLFDLSTCRGKHAFVSFSDNYAFRSIAFHPSGEYLAAGSDGNEVRLYNANSSKGYLLADGAGRDNGQHEAGITQVCYSAEGGLIGSSSLDGSVKIWDGGSGKCVRTINRAHGGKEATGVAFSRNARYILSTGNDSRVCLWDTGSGKLLNTYEGASLDGQPSQAVFSFDESTVMVPDSRRNDVVVWDAASARYLGRVAKHKDQITRISPSPKSLSFMSCSVDECVRYWASQKQQ